MKLTARHYETKTVAELEKFEDELVKKSAVLEHEIPVLQQKIDTLKAAKRKLKRAKR
jgi:phage shock protein A